MTEMQRFPKDYRPILDGPVRYHGGQRRKLSVRTAETAKYWNWTRSQLRRAAREEAA